MVLCSKAFLLPCFLAAYSARWILQHFWCLEMPWDALRCLEMPWDALRCLEMPWDALRCLEEIDWDILRPLDPLVSPNFSRNFRSFSKSIQEVHRSVHRSPVRSFQLHYWSPSAAWSSVAAGLALTGIAAFFARRTWQLVVQDLYGFVIFWCCVSVWTSSFILTCTYLVLGPCYPLFLCFTCSFIHASYHCCSSVLFLFYACALAILVCRMPACSFTCSTLRTSTPVMQQDWVLRSARQPPPKKALSCHWATGSGMQRPGTVMNREQSAATAVLNSSAEHLWQRPPKRFWVCTVQIVQESNSWARPFMVHFCGSCAPCQTTREIPFWHVLNLNN